METSKILPGGSLNAFCNSGISEVVGRILTVVRHIFWFAQSSTTKAVELQPS